MPILDDLDFVTEDCCKGNNRLLSCLDSELKTLKSFVETDSTRMDSKEYMNAEIQVRLLVKKTRACVLKELEKDENNTPACMELLEVVQDLTERLEELETWQGDFQDGFGYKEKLSVLLDEIEDIVSEIDEKATRAATLAAAPAPAAPVPAAPAATPADLKKAFYRLPLIIDKAVEEMLDQTSSEPAGQELAFARLFLTGVLEEKEELPQGSAPGLQLHQELASQLKADLKKLGCEGSKAPRDVQQILSRNAEVILKIQKMGSAAQEVCKSKTNTFPDSQRLCEQGLKNFFNQIEKALKQ